MAEPKIILIIENGDRVEREFKPQEFNEEADRFVTRTLSEHYGVKQTARQLGITPQAAYKRLL